MPESTVKYHHVPVAKVKKGDKLRTQPFVDAEGNKTGVLALLAFPAAGGSSRVVKYMFDRSKFPSMQEAKAWIQDHKKKKQSQKAQWSTAYVNDLPDSAFLYVASGGKKDEDGKTIPRSSRYFPVYDSAGSIDLPHLNNALARIPQSKVATQFIVDKAVFVKSK